MSESKEYVKGVADESLKQFELIAVAAKTKLDEPYAAGADALAYINTLTSGQVIKRLGDISHANAESYRILAAEPAIARVVVSDNEGLERCYYICRATPVSGVANLASYRSPVGRLASKPVGSEFKLPNGEVVEVKGRATLQPQISTFGWDSCNTVIESNDFRPFTIESLRTFLLEIEREGVAGDILGQLLSEESSRANIVEGKRRALLTKMALRDQPILDQYQDEIFRLPLAKRLLILGAPGTGKTTTLIRRLGQKLDLEFLDESERQLVESVGLFRGITHRDSWQMFTPTELLKQYLKEAFAREGVPASDMHIFTWQDYRRELGRNVFSILRTAAGGGTFVLKDSLPVLTPDAVQQSIDWYSDFDSWQRTTFLEDLRDAARTIAGAPLENVAVVGGRLKALLSRYTSGDSLSLVLGALVDEVEQVAGLVSSMKDSSDEKIRRALNLQLIRDRSFLDTLSTYLDVIQQTQNTDLDEVDDLEGEEEEEGPLPRTGRTAALNAYMQAVRAQARAVASKRSLRNTSRNAKVIEWLGDRTLGQDDQIEIGKNLLLQARLRRFVNPVRRYLTGIPRRYRVFRRERKVLGRWYVNATFDSRDIHPLELDVVLLSLLQGGQELLTIPKVLRDIDNPIWSPLKSMLELCRNQIVVDEATDFSPIQLAAMSALGHPRIRSFFACGDFNQRLTTWGARSAGDLSRMLPDLEFKEITVSYRQTRQLNEFARALIQVVGGSDQSISLPDLVDSEGVAPVLLESATDSSSVVNWLADRIREIERFVNQLPSIAIFINSEESALPLAEALNTALAEQNIQVIPCLQGQAVGQDSSVRIFDIQHIKGLEFEAAFFIAIDHLANMHPELFDKYLYVGTTRAATYLGITCEGTLPSAIEALRPRFVTDWISD